MSAALQEIVKEPAVSQALHALGAKPYVLSAPEMYREVSRLAIDMTAIKDGADLILE